MSALLVLLWHLGQLHSVEKLLVGVIAERDGLFAAGGARLSRLPLGARALLVAALGLIALVTAVLNLDTSVFFLTPVLLHLARHRGIDEAPFLYGTVFMSNAASLFLPGSNLTNLIVLHHEHVAGATFLAIPSSFTRQTGEAHWHVLMRARAIENGCFVIAAAQGGDHEDGRSTFGHSLVVDPWGKVIAEGGTEPGVIFADIDPAEVAVARGRVPSLQHGRRFEILEPMAEPTHLHVVGGEG